MNPYFFFSFREFFLALIHWAYRRLYRAYAWIYRIVNRIISMDQFLFLTLISGLLIGILAGAGLITALLTINDAIHGDMVPGQAWATALVCIVVLAGIVYFKKHRRL